MQNRMGLIQILSVLLLLFVSNVWAGPATELAGADNNARAELIEKWTGNPDPKILAVLSALADGQLLVDSAGKAYLQGEQGVLDAETGQAVTVDASTLDTVVVNNRIRGSLEAALSAGKLAAPDLATRREAIKAIQENSNPALLPLIEKQLAVETDAQLKQQLGVLRANLQLAHPDTKIRLAAIESLRHATDPAVVARLNPLTQSETEAAPEVRKAASQAIADIQGRVRLHEMAGHAFNGLSLGSILLLAALGLAITYGLLGVINMAHGEMMLIGAYAAYVMQNVFQRFFPGAFEWYLVAALPVAFIVAGLVGILLERLVIRHLYGRPQETLLATWGISLVLIQLAKVIFSPQNVAVANPNWMSGGWEISPVLTITWSRLLIIAFAFAVLGMTWLVLNKTRLGLFIRAVTQNRRMAACVGVPTERVDMLAFGLGSGIAGLAGVALSQIGNVGPELGQGYIIDSFMVVVLGGVGQLAGSVYAALGLGVISKVMEPAIGAVLAKIAILVFIILFIQKRPMGLFALKGRSLD